MNLKLSKLYYFILWVISGGYYRYKNMFGNKHRVYLNLVDEDNCKMSVHKQVSIELNKNGYVLKDYSKGLAHKKDNIKNIYKIGKILQKSNPMLKNLYDSDFSRKGTKINTNEMMVVISRHPFDIMMMSTARKWTSCMNIDGGCNSRYIAKDIKHGTIIAYLIEDNDKKIKNPLARILIKPYTNEKNIVLSMERTYGTPIKEFEETVELWLSKYQTDKKGLFNLHKKLYNDGRSLILLGDKKTYKLISTYYKYFLVQVGSKIGLLDKNGNVIIEPIYEYGTYDQKYNIFYYSENYNSHNDKKKMGCIILSSEGEMIKKIEPKYRHLSAISNSLFIVYDNIGFNCGGIMDYDCNLILEPKHTFLYLSESLLIYSANNVSTFYDIKNRAIRNTVNHNLPKLTLISKNPLIISFIDGNSKKVTNDKGEIVLVINCNAELSYNGKSLISVYNRYDSTSAIYNIETKKYVSEFSYNSDFYSGRLRWL